MKIYKNIKLSRKTLLTHKLRTFLALVGITIGVAAVIIMIAIGKGAQSEVLNQIEEMGTNLIIVNAGRVNIFAGRKRQVSYATTLTLKDSKAISSECPSVTLTAPAQSKKLQVKYGNVSTNTMIIGTTCDFQKIRNFSIGGGSFFSEMENKAALRVAVIGNKVQVNLFDGDDPIGEIIRVGKTPFEVIGVLESKGVNAEGVDEDDQIIIPINTALRRVFNLDYINTVYAQVKDIELMDKAEAEIRDLLRERHRLEKKAKSDDFTIQNQADVLEAQQEATAAFTMLIAGIAAISLMVGGIGILAIMLITIKERTNEIGLRMAVGARPKDIMVQFLSEASILGFSGGFFGMVIGIIGTIIVAITTEWHTVISLQSIFLSIGFSLSVGLFFGVYPAKKAAMLDPIDALRAE
jgi:putative ABC transport system permease protein